MTTNGRGLRLFLTAGAGIDVALGAALAIAPGPVFSVGGLEIPDDTVYVRFLGVQVAGVGAVSLLANRRPADLASVVRATAAARFAGGAVLVKGGPNAPGGSPILVALGVGELVVGVAQLLHARRATASG